MSTTSNLYAATITTLNGSAGECSETSLYGPAGQGWSNPTDTLSLAPIAGQACKAVPAPFAAALAAGAPSKTKPCQTCEVINAMAGSEEAQALRAILADGAWSLVAVSDLIARATGKHVKQSALWRHVNNHTGGRR